MPFDLNQFRNKLTDGAARPSQFEMRITWPQQIPSGAAAAEDLRYFCQVSEIPGDEIGFVAVPFFGRKLFFAGDRTYSPLTVTILNDEKFKIRSALEAWQKAITGYSTTVSQFNGGITADSYATTGEVRQYTRNNNGQAGVPIRVYKFIGMFPVLVSPIALDWNATDQVETFTTQFVYQWWEDVNPATGESSE